MKEIEIKISLNRDAARLAAQSFDADQKALMRETAARERTAAKASEALAKQTAREKAKADKEAAAASVAAIKAKEAQEKKAADTTISLAKATAAFGLQMIGLDSAKAVVGAIVDNFERARESAYQASKMVTDYRESLLELAALKDKLGKTTEVTKEDLIFRAKTGQTPEQAREFQLAALGGIESAVDTPTKQRLISKEEAEKALVLGGAFQTTESGAAKTHGRLVSLIPTLLGRRTTGEEVFQQEKRIFNILKPGSFAFESGVEQLASLAPLITSGTVDLGKTTALLSAFSTVGKPEESATNVEHLVRATLGGVNRKGKPRIEGAVPQGEYYKSIGITDELIDRTKATDLPFVIGAAIAEDLDKEQARAREQGREYQPYLYLKEHGFVNKQDVDALQQFQALRKSGALEDTFLPLAAEENLPDVQKSIADIKEVQRSDPLMAARKAGYAEELANVAVGAGKPEHLRSLMRFAFAERRARGEESYETYDEVQGLSAFSPGEVLFGHRRKTELEAQRIAEREATRLGIDLSPRAGFGGELGEPAATQGYRGPEALYDLMKRIRAKGGSTIPGLEGVLGAATRALDESQAFEDLGAPPGVAAAPPGAAPPPMLAAPTGGLEGGGGQAVDLLKSLITVLTPKPVAPDPKPLIGRAKQLMRN